MPKRQLTLERKLDSDQGTFGRLSGQGLSLFTAELPWRDNKTDISRIPPGTYECVPYNSEKYPNTFTLKAVPGRTAILIHVGNWAGDVHKKLRSNSNGCILVGLKAGEISRQQAVLESKPAMDKLRYWADGQGFTLTIIDALRERSA